MRFSPIRRCLVCAGVCVIVVTTVAPQGAQSAESLAVESTDSTRGPEPAGELTLGQAIQVALARNPELAASDYELKAADARIIQAGLRRNPEVSVQLDNLGIQGAAHGSDALATTLSLSQVIEMGGKRGYRTEVATVDREVAGVEQQARQLDVLAEVTRRFITVVAAQERVAFTGEAKELTQHTLAAITARVRAARSPEAEGSRARIALTRILIESEQAESELRSARSALVALWGTQEPAFSQAKADLFKLDPVEPFDALVEKLRRNPQFIRFASEARLRDAELRLAQAQARPNITLGVGVGRFNETRNTGLIASFSMPLPLFDRNQGGIREAQVKRAQSEAQGRAAFLRARAAVFGLYQELLASRVRLDILRSDALSQAQQAVDQTQYGYERGRFSYLELATAQQELLALRAAVIEAAADYHRVLTEIERLTGEPLALTTFAQEVP